MTSTPFAIGLALSNRSVNEIVCAVSDWIIARYKHVPTVNIISPYLSRLPNSKTLDRQ
jgi:hypothetical protein